MLAYQPQTNPTLNPSLQLIGSCGYQIQDQKVLLSIVEIANLRDMGNISGSLSLELWALKTPYAGGNFEGIALAGTKIGSLYGKHSLLNCHYELDFVEPSAGTWQLCLMLREWNGFAFETRHYVNFAIPYTVVSKVTVVKHEANNVINVNFNHTRVLEPTPELTNPQQAESTQAELAPEQTTAVTGFPVIANTAPLPLSFWQRLRQWFRG